MTWKKYERVFCLLKEFARYTSFNILAMLSFSVYILADTFFISLALGASGLAALNFAIPIYGFVYGTGLMLGLGGATKYSISKSTSAFTHTILAMAFFSVIFLIGGLFFTSEITRAFGAGTDYEIFQMTSVYLNVILLFSPVFLLNYVIICFVRNDGAPQLSMIAMVSGSFSNILLDYIFLFILDMGMFGAALATGFSAIIGLVIMLSFFVKKKNNFYLKKCTLSIRIFGSIFSTGLPTLVAELSFGLVMIIFNIIIFGISGNVGVAAFGIIANIALVVIAVYNGLAQGIQPLLSKYYGNGNILEVKLVLRYALILTTTLSVVIYAGVFFWAPQIIAIFNSEGVLALLYLAETGIRIYFIACLFIGLNIVMSIYFTSTGNPSPAHKISVLCGFLVIIPMVFLLSFVGGIIGVWMALPVTELIVFAVAYRFFRSYKF